MKQILLTKDSSKFKKVLKEISYMGNDSEYLDNELIQSLYRNLIVLYSIAEEYFKEMPFIRMYGSNTCREISQRLCEVVEHVCRDSFKRKRKHTDPMFSCIDFSRLLSGYRIEITGNKIVDQKFWKKSSDILSIDINGITYTFPRLAIFYVIYKIEKKLRIKGGYRKSFIRIPRGFVLSKGTIAYLPWKAMRKLRLELRGLKPHFDLMNGTICYLENQIKPLKEVEILKRSMRIPVTSSVLKNMYGECIFETIADTERNFTYLLITNPKGKIMCFEYFQKWLPLEQNIYVEVDILEKKQKMENLNRFYKNPTIIDHYKDVKTIITQFPSESIEIGSTEIGINEYIVSKLKISPQSKLKRIKKPKLIKQFVSPLCKNGNLPTIQASSAKPCWYNMISTGHRPNAGVVEIWQSDSISAQDFPLTWFQKILYYSPLFERKYEGYDPQFTKDLDIYKGRKVSNSGLLMIFKEVKNLRPNQYIRLRSRTGNENLHFMGVKKVETEKLNLAGISNKDKSHMAGNSIPVPLLIPLFRSMLIPNDLEDTPKLIA